MYGIEETKQLVKLFIDFGNAIGTALEDGKISLTDASDFFPAIKDMPAAFMGIAKVPAELKDLTKEEVDELLEYAKNEFDIPEEEVEVLVEKALTFTAQAYAFISSFLKAKK